MRENVDWLENFLTMENSVLRNRHQILGYYSELAMVKHLATPDKHLIIN